MSKTRYKSPTTGKEVRAIQYLTELLLIRKYRSRKQVLPPNFWRIDPYKKEFKQQLFWLNRIFKIYHESVIIKVFNKKEFDNAYSVKFPGIEEDLVLEQKLFEDLKNVEATEYKDYSQSEPSKQFSNRKSILSKLNE